MANFRAYLQCRRCDASRSLMSAAGDAVYQIGADRAAGLDAWLEEHTGYAPNHEGRDDVRYLTAEQKRNGDWLSLTYE